MSKVGRSYLLLAIRGILCIKIVLEALRIWSAGEALTGRIK